MLVLWCRVFLLFYLIDNCISIILFPFLVHLSFVRISNLIVAKVHQRDKWESQHFLFIEVIQFSKTQGKRLQKIIVIQTFPKALSLWNEKFDIKHNGFTFITEGWTSSHRNCTSAPSSTNGRQRLKNHFKNWIWTAGFHTRTVN